MTLVTLDGTEVRREVWAVPRCGWGRSLWVARSQMGQGLDFELAFWLLLLLSCPVVSDSFSTPWIEIFPGKNTGVGCHFLSPGDLPNPGIAPTSLESPAWAGGFFTTEPPGKLCIVL